MNPVPAVAVEREALDSEVTVVHGLIEADVVQGVLAGYGISTRLESQVPLALWPSAVSGLAQARVLARATEVDRARDLLTGHRQAGMRIVENEGAP